MIKYILLFIGQNTLLILIVHYFDCITMIFWQTNYDFVTALMRVIIVLATTYVVYLFKRITMNF